MHLGKFLLNCSKGKTYRENCILSLNALKWLTLSSSSQTSSKNGLFIETETSFKRNYSLYTSCENSILCQQRQNLTGKFEHQLLFRTVRKSTKHLDNIINDDAVGMNSVGQIKYCSRARDQTKLLIHKKLSSFRKSILLRKSQFKDKLKAHKLRGLQTVGNLKRTLKAKKEDIKTVPNLLTTLRMASAPVLAYLVVHDYFGTASFIFVMAGLTDLLDGYIARNFKNQRTALGTALDPLADKLLISFLGISLTSAGLIPVPMTALIISRDFGLILASFYVRYISLPPPRTISRYFDVSLVTAKLYPSTISKINTGLQLSYVATTLASPVFDFVDHPLLQGLMYLTAVTTVISGVDYVLTWRKRLKIMS